MIRAASLHTPITPRSPAVRTRNHTVEAGSQADGLLTITFDDGSVMKVKTAPSNANSAATGGKVAKVRQEDTTLSLDLESGGSVTIQTPEATDSVMLRDKAGKWNMPIEHRPRRRQERRRAMNAAMIEAATGLELEKLVAEYVMGWSEVRLVVQSNALFGCKRNAKRLLTARVDGSAESEVT